jgi:hypothetical protein
MTDEIASDSRHLLAGKKGIAMKRTVIGLALAMVVFSGCKMKSTESVTTDETAAPVSTASAAPALETAEPPVPPQAAVTLAAGAPIPGTGVALWLIADDAKGGEGGVISSWTNAQVAGLTAEADPDAGPSVVPNALNGHAVLRFDGQNDMLKTNVDLSPERMPTATVFTVFNTATADAAPLRKLYGNDNGGYDRAVGLDDRGGDPAKNYCAFTGSGVTPLFAIKANEFHIGADQFTATDFSNWIDGVATVVKSPAKWDASLPNLYIGNTGTSYSEHWQGDLAEMIVYARTLSDAERMQVEDYLAKKYGLALTRVK